MWKKTNSYEWQFAIFFPLICIFLVMVILVGIPSMIILDIITNIQYRRMPKNLREKEDKANAKTEWSRR